MLCGSCIQHKKNSLKFKLLAFGTPFIDQKYTYEKVTKNLDRALPPPSFGQNPKEHLLFFVKPPEITRSRGSQKVVDCPTQLFIPRQTQNNTPQKSAIQIVRRSKLHLPDLNNLNLDWDPLITFIAKALCLWKPSSYIDKALLLLKARFSNESSALHCVAFSSRLLCPSAREVWQKEML